MEIDSKKEKARFRINKTFIAAVMLCIADLVAFNQFFRAPSYNDIAGLCALMQIFQVFAAFIMMKTMFAFAREEHKRRYYLPLVCYFIYMMYYFFMMFDAFGLIQVINGYDLYSSYRIFLRLAELLLAVFVFIDAREISKKKIEKIGHRIRVSIMPVLVIIINGLLMFVHVNMAGISVDESSAGLAVLILVIMASLAHIFTGIHYARYETKGNIKGTMAIATVAAVFFVATIGNYFLYRKSSGTITRSTASANVTQAGSADSEDEDDSAHKEAAEKAVINQSFDTEKSLTEQIETYLNTATDQFSGAVTIQLGSTTLIQRTYGIADRDTGKACSTEDIFSIMSSTGQFAAVAVYQLQDQGKLSVDDTVNQFFPQYREGAKITISDLLYHTSGIEDYTKLLSENISVLTELYGQDSVKVRQQLDMKKAFTKLISGHYLVADPGKEYNLSKSDNYLLGLIVEAVSGQTFEEYVTEHILKPLGMEHTYFNEENVTLKGYTKSGSEVERENNDSYYYSANGMSSTLQDMQTFQNALLSGKLISEHALNSMFTVSEATKRAQGFEQADCGWRVYTGNTGSVVIQYMNTEYDVQLIGVFNSMDGEPVSRMYVLESAIYNYYKNGGADNGRE